ncbi:MAG: hypothetical protein WCA06_00325, partial [Terrimicrobiaceae bacterium]
RPQLATERQSLEWYRDAETAIAKKRYQVFAVSLPSKDYDLGSLRQHSQQATLDLLGPFNALSGTHLVEGFLVRLDDLLWIEKAMLRRQNIPSVRVNLGVAPQTLKQCGNVKVFRRSGSGSLGFDAGHERDTHDHTTIYVCCLDFMAVGAPGDSGGSPWWSELKKVVWIAVHWIAG